MASTGGRLAAVADVDDQLSVARDAPRYRTPDLMLPTAADVEPLIRHVLHDPKAVAEDGLMVLGGELLLCLRDDDNGISADYAALADGADLQQDVTEALANLPVSPSNPTIDPLLATFKRDDQFYEAMHALLAMTIPIATTNRVNPATLGPMQIYVLTQLAAATTIWGCDMTLQDRLAKRGLPTTKNKLNLMLAALG